jgi:uncharacterized membrane protein
MSWGNHMSTGAWILAIFGMLIILALIVGTLAWLLSDLGGHGGSPAPGVSAREILDRRLASGEIARDEYDQLREKLATTSPPSNLPARSAAGAPG